MPRTVYSWNKPRTMLVVEIVVLPTNVVDGHPRTALLSMNQLCREGLPWLPVPYRRT